MYNIPKLETLIDSIDALPSIGRKSAQRIAFHLMSLDEEKVKEFINDIEDAKKSIKSCKCCQAMSDSELCSVCNDPTRNKEQICVVETSLDVVAFEKTNEYNGLYHVLGGLMSPVDGISPDMLKIRELLHRVAENDIKEVILATNPTSDGDCTAMYIQSLLKDFQIKVTRLAYGMPVGGSLEYADQVTLLKAFEGRNEF